MSKTDEPNQPTPAPVPSSALVPGAQTHSEVARESDNTEEWDVGVAPARDVPVGESSSEVHYDTLPSVDVSVFSADHGAAPEGPELPPLQETPTAPLPLDEAEDMSTGEIDLAEADELVETITQRMEAQRQANGAAGMQARAATLASAQEDSVLEEVDLVDEPDSAGTPPPVPVQPAARKPVLPPLPVVAVAPSSDPASETWAEPLAARPRRKRTKPWYEEVFDEDYLRTLPYMTAEQTLREVNFIKASLEPPEGGEILDVACGYGRHSIELAQRSLRVTGIDLSLPLLIRAADESQRRSLSVNFVHADMREMSFDSQFDGACCMMTSFGFIDEETNLKVASGIFRALKPGGRFLIDAINRDYIVGDLPTRVWWEGDGCVVLEEVDFNFHTSRVSVRRSIVFQDGRQIEQDISIRAYSLHELGRLLRQAGFRVTEVSGSLATRGNFFGATSRNLFVLCEKPL